MDSDSMDVPRYFICPISLQIMKDPVTISTGITYDRENIEKWLFQNKNHICPFTNQPLSQDLTITPNLNLRRLIQAWCKANEPNGATKISTPREPLNKPLIAKLLNDLSNPKLTSQTLSLLSSLSSDSQSNRIFMIQAGVPKTILSIIIKSYRVKQFQLAEEALSLIISLGVSNEVLKPLVEDNYEIIESLNWVLKQANSDNNDRGFKCDIIVFLKTVIELVNPAIGDRIKPRLFLQIISVLEANSSPQIVKAALKVLLQACLIGTNKSKISEAGAVKTLIEIELSGTDRRTSELLLGLMGQLCSTANGRADLVGHAAGIAVVAKRILRVSPLVDDLSVGILSSVCKFCGTKEVVQEMLRVGAVSKLCLVLQADCSAGVKEKARRLLRSHSEAWKNSPCVSSYLITRYP